MTVAQRRRVLASLVGTVFFLVSVWYLSVHIDWKPVLTVLERADAQWIVLSGIASLMFFGLRAWRLYIMARNVNANANYRDVYVVTAVTLAFSMITPAQTGEAIKIEFLKRLGVLDRMAGAGTFVVERALDLLTLAAVGLVALGVSRASLANMGYLHAALVLIVLASAFGIWVLLKVSVPGKGRLISTRLRASIGNADTLFCVVILSVLSWVAVALGWNLALRGVGIDLTQAQTLVLMAVVAFAQAATFIPGGLGVSEVVTLELLQQFGVPAADAVAGAVVLRCYAMLAIGIGSAHWIFWRGLAARQSVA